MEITPRGRLSIGVLVGLGFSALFFNDLILFLIFTALLILLLSEFVWMMVVSSRPNKFFVLSNSGATIEPTQFDQKRKNNSNNNQKTEIRSSVALGEATSQEYNFAMKARSNASLFCDIPYLKMIPREFQRSERIAKIRFEFRSPFIGTYSLEKIKVHFVGPFSLFATDSSIGVNLRYVVYPKIYDIALQSSKILGKSGIGEIPTEFPGIGTEFYDMRQYQRGDDIRNVNWKASARLGELIVNERAREVGAAYYLVLETGAKSYFDRDRLASSFLQIANFLSLLGANFGVIIHDGKKVTSFKEIDRPQESLFFALSASLDFAKINKEEITGVELIPPIPGHAIKSMQDALSKEGLTLLSQMESLGQQQMITSVENNDVFKTIMDKMKQNPSESPAILFICQLYSSQSIAPIIEASSELKRAYGADFVVLDPTAPWVVAQDEQEATLMYEKQLRKLQILSNSQVQYYVGDPLNVAEQAFV